MKQSLKSIKITILIFVLLLLALITFGQDRKLVLDFHNKTEKEISNFVWGQSPMGLEVMTAVEDYHSFKNKFEFVVLDTVLAYRSKIDGQLKKIGRFITIKKEIKTTSIIFQHNIELPLIKLQNISVVGDSLEFEEAINFSVIPVVLNSNLIPEKELQRRKEDLDKEFSKIYNRLQNGRDNSNWSLLEQIAYDLARSMCNEGLFKSGRPAAYFVTPIGLIDQLLKQPVNLIGKAQVKSAIKKLAKLKKLKADLQLAQKLYEKQYLVKE